jgi:hypothetical protein
MHSSHPMLSTFKKVMGMCTTISMNA